MKAILACDEAGGIGLNGSLPWPRISEDLQRFRKLTTGQTVIMGRGTWEAPDMPHPLPKRINVVVSRSRIEDLPDTVIHLGELPKNLPDAWVIGGAKLFLSALPHITELHLTRVPDNYNCDTTIDLKWITNNFSLEREEKYTNHTYQIWRRL